MMKKQNQRAISLRECDMPEKLTAGEKLYMEKHGGERPPWLPPLPSPSKQISDITNTLKLGLLSGEISPADSLRARKLIPSWFKEKEPKKEKTPSQKITDRKNRIMLSVSEGKPVSKADTTFINKIMPTFLGRGVEKEKEPERATEEYYTGKLADALRKRESLISKYASEPSEEDSLLDIPPREVPPEVNLLAKEYGGDIKAYTDSLQTIKRGKELFGKDFAIRRDMPELDNAYKEYTNNRDAIINAYKEHYDLSDRANLKKARLLATQLAIKQFEVDNKISFENFMDSYTKLKPQNTFTVPEETAKDIVNKILYE